MAALTILVHHESWMDGGLERLAGRHRIVRDHSLSSQADVVLFHLPTLRSVGIRRRPRQLWVAWSCESEENYPLMRILRARGRGIFDLWMTYRQDSEVWCPYFEPELGDQLRCPPRAVDQKPWVAYFGSNENDRWGRRSFVRELMEHLRVDSFGRSLNNMTLSVDRGPDTKRQVIAGYKFTLALENSVARDYVTEKFFEPLVAGSVPVYFGAPNVGEFAPGERCFVDAREFRGPRELAAYLRRIALDEKAYAEYHAWRGRPFREQFQRMLELVRAPTFERLADCHRAAFGR